MTTTLAAARAEPTATPPRAGARQWLGLAVLLLPVTLMTVDLGVLWLATPYLSADLRPSGAQLLWITDIYGFLTATTLVIMGTLGDRLGRRKLLMAGSAGFLLASLLAAYAPNAGTLIAARSLLGVAGAAVLPSTLALISHMFTDAPEPSGVPPPRPVALPEPGLHRRAAHPAPGDDRAQRRRVPGPAVPPGDRRTPAP